MHRLWQDAVARLALWLTWANLRRGLMILATAAVLVLMLQTAPLDLALIYSGELVACADLLAAVLLFALRGQLRQVTGCVVASVRRRVRRAGVWRTRAARRRRVARKPAARAANDNEDPTKAWPHRAA